MRNDPLLILSALGAILALAGLAVFLLSGFAPESATIGVIENVNSRIKAWWWIVGILGGAVLLGRAAVIGVFAVISFVALREFLTLTAVKSADRRAVVASFLVALPAQYVLVGIGRYDLYSVFLPAFGLLIVPLFTALSSDTRNYLARTAELGWGLILCIYCVSYAPALIMLHIPRYENRQPLLMVFLVLVTQASDVLQYAWGKMLGRHKVAPEISPSKTVEGLVGGIVSATALGASLWWITPFSVGQAGAMALLIAAAGFLGGLILSAIKRDRGVKDWSRLIPGHGGMLDRLDSVCFSAPVFFHLTRMFFAT